MVDKDFIVYDNNGKPERRIKLDLTLQNISFDLRTLCNRQTDCDTDRKEIRDTAEEAERKIDNHVLVGDTLKNQGKSMFSKVTTVAGLVLAAAAIFVTYLIATAEGNEIRINSFYANSQLLSTPKTERIQEFIYGVNTDTSTKELGMKFSCDNVMDEKPVLTVKLSRQCLTCKSCRKHAIPILKNVSNVISFEWHSISDSRRMNFVNKIGEIIYITDTDGRFKKVEKII